MKLLKVIAAIFVICSLGLHSYADEVKISPGVILVESLQGDKPDFESFLHQFYDADANEYLFPTELEWMSGIALQSLDVVEMIRSRTSYANFRFFEKVLKSYAKLSEIDQLMIAYIEAGQMTEEEAKKLAAEYRAKVGESEEK